MEGLCIYEEVNTSFACMQMDVETLTDGMDLTFKQQEILARIKSNARHGMDAIGKVRLVSRSIAETLETLYPTLYWERFGVIARLEQEDREKP